MIPGITDSKKVTNEEQRQILYSHIISSSNVRYSIAIVDNTMIDTFPKYFSKTPNVSRVRFSVVKQ